MDFPKRGEIWIARLDPAIGSEINKTRLVCVISNDINNEYSPILTVLPVTGRGSRSYPTEVELSAAEVGIKKDSKILCQQIRSLDKKRLVNHVADLSQGKIKAVERALAIHLGIIFKD